MKKYVNVNLVVAFIGLQSFANYNKPNEFGAVIKDHSTHLSCYSEHNKTSEAQEIQNWFINKKAKLSQKKVKTRAIAQNSSSEYDIPDRREFPINEKINPCEDFHQYVCSKVEASFKLRPDRTSHIFSLYDARERLLSRKIKFVENLTQENGLPERPQQFVDFYKACINEEDRLKDELNWVQKISGEILQINSIEELLDYNYQNFLSGKPSLINFGITPSALDTKKLVAYLLINLSYLPERSYYEKADLIEAYEDIVLSILKIVEPETSEKALKSRAKRVVKFEAEFAKIFPLPAERREIFSQNHETTQSEVLRKHPKLRLKETFFKMLPSDVAVSNYLPAINDYVSEKLNNENLKTLKDLYSVQLVSSFVEFSEANLHKKQFNFRHKFLGGPAVESPNNEKCTIAVMQNFAKELDELMIQREYGQFPEAKVIALAEQIRLSIIDGMKKNTWLSDEARSEAIKKIQVAKLQLVKPKNSKEWNFLPVKKYNPKQSIANSFLRNQAKFEHQLNSLKSGRNKDAWNWGPLTVNASYNPVENIFNLPMGILQYPVFDDQNSEIENLAAMGVIIGHELGHGLDDQGARYDSSGVMRSWMTEADRESFKKRSLGLIEQFNQIGHNGKLTLGENIGDLVGVSFAYKAAFPETSSMTDLEKKRQFFISYAKVWCGVRTEGEKERYLKTNPHSLGYARINEQVKNQKGFAEAFSCQPGDRMTLPEEKRVSIW